MSPWRRSELYSSLSWAASVAVKPQLDLRYLQGLHVVNKSRLKSNFHPLSIDCLCSLFIKETEQNKSDFPVKVDLILCYQVRIAQLLHIIIIITGLNITVPSKYTISYITLILSMIQNG